MHVHRRDRHCQEEARSNGDQRKWCSHHQAIFFHQQLLRIMCLSALGEGHRPVPRAHPCNAAGWAGNRAGCGTPKRRKFAFLKTDESTIKHLISQICVIDGASDIIDVEKNFRKQIRYSCIPKYENQICERLEGWWYKKAIEALCSDTPIFVTQSQVRSFIVSVSQEYAECPYQPGNLTAFAAVKFTVKGADNDMAVFRVEKNKGYTVMSNHHLRDKALSLKAKGLLSQKSLF